MTVAAAGGTIQVMAVTGLPQCGQGRVVWMAQSPGAVPAAVMVPPVVAVPPVVMAPRAAWAGMGSAAWRAGLRFQAARHRFEQHF